MTPNQKVNVTGTLSFSQKEPKKVLVKSTQEVSFVKEDCILEDSTGHTSIHIWSPLITQLKNTYSYRLNNLTVKNFQGNTFLSTSPFTTYTQQVNTLSSFKGRAILETPEKQIFVDSFKLVSKLSIFLSCQVCKKRITDVSRASVKCQNCSTHQKVVDCKREASAKLCVANEDADLWLTIFTDTLKNLLQQKSSVTLQNTTEEVAETLLSASNIFITFDPQTNVVSKMQHALTSDNQSSAKIEATDHNRATHDNETTFGNPTTHDNETTFGNPTTHDNETTSGNAPAYDNKTTSENAATHDNETTSGNGATRDNETVSQSGNGVTDHNWLGITNDNQAADENWLDAIDDNTAPDDSWIDAIK
ncbi:uncharacterized protein [Montipora foliosa]|uniref:uncharacterized protein n=1 Tax=Montipora foliosa TaxID=591990 RepID=UPI0035F18F41